MYSSKEKFRTLDSDLSLFTPSYIALFVAFNLILGVQFFKSSCSAPAIARFKERPAYDLAVGPSDKRYCSGLEEKVGNSYSFPLGNSEQKYFTSNSGTCE